MRLKSLLIVFLLIIGISCKKENGNNSGNSSNPATIKLTLLDDQLFHLGVGLIESDKAITSFDGKISIGGIEVDGVQASNNSVAFGVPETVPAGSQKLIIALNNEEPQELSLQIAALPVVSNPEQVVIDYKLAIEDLNQTTQTLFDSTVARFNIPSNPIADANIDALNDSLNYYINAFNNASPEEKMVAAKVMNAQLLDVKDLVKSMKETMFLMSISSSFGKMASPCNDPEFNASQAWYCVLTEFRSNMIGLLLDCTVNWAIGGAIGGAFGILSSGGFAAGVGAAIGINVANFFNAISVFNFLKANVYNLASALVISYHELFGKKELQFTNDEYTAVNYSLTRRNLQSSDINSEFEFIKGYVKVYTDFVNKVKSYFPDKVDAIPDFQGLKERTGQLEDLSYLRFEVKGNNKVNLLDVGGTASRPELLFTTDETGEQSFTLVAFYDDGVFSTTNEFDAKLGGGEYTWLVGEYETRAYPGYNGECSPNPGTKAEVYFCIDKNGKQANYFKSATSGIDPQFSTYGSIDLTNGSKGSAYAYGQDFYMSFTGLVYSGQTLESDTTGYIYLKAPGGAGTGCGNSIYQYYYRNKLTATNVGSQTPAGLSPTELQQIMDLLK